LEFFQFTSAKWGIRALARTPASDKPPGLSGQTLMGRTSASISGALVGEPRRRWPEEERARILAEAMAPGAIASHVARRFGVSTGQFYTWRKAMLLRSAPVGVTPALAKADFVEGHLRHRR
jgi:hypothetical protein